MTTREEPLDERQWEDQNLVSFLGGVGAHNIHVYFTYSPFCDPTSNNKVFELQARSNANMRAIFGDRRLFETRLQTLTGIEYIIADGPQENTDNMNPVWLIRKQRREKRARQADHITVLATYFAVAHHVYQAPSIADVITGHLARVSYAMNDFFATAADMQFYTPATGHGYFPSVQKTTLKMLGAESRNTSRAGTPMPELAQQASQKNGAPTKRRDGPASSSEQGVLHQSFLMSVNYGDEYMDENELVGEPGSMSFTSTQAHLRSTQEKQKAASQQSLLASQRTSSRNTSAQPTPPPQIKTEGLPKKVSKTHASPVSAGPSKLKRRKSKAPTSPQTISPT